jgi:hypothetical protein
MKRIPSLVLGLVCFLVAPLWAQPPARSSSEVLRYAEAIVAGDGAFEFKHLAPGRYWLLAKPATDRPLTWDAATRAATRNRKSNSNPASATRWARDDFEAQNLC